MPPTSKTLEEKLRAAPAEMLWEERLLLYTLVRGLKPKRVLEIGVYHGGSTAIISDALDQNGCGMLSSIDPHPDLKIDWESVAHRVVLYRGYSPAILKEVHDAAGGHFDFCFIDADHSYGGVLRDAIGVMPYMAPGSYILFHDAHFADINAAIDDFLLTRTGITDCGILSTERSGLDSEGRGPWGGLRLVRVRSTTGFSAPAVISRGVRFLRKRLRLSFKG
ncbi:MAG: class I SAM-dependent methyltransferase [Nitrospiraceae bacterium]